jgi:pSer/pThr/pTyr-binding forkhead associated (FHA) protein
VDTLTPLLPIISRDLKTNWGTAYLGSHEKITLHIGSPTAKPIHFCLTRPLVFGRFAGDDPDIHINLQAYTGTQKGVSRQHASLTLVANIVMLTDLESANGTFLNGQQLTPNKHYVVRNGSEIRLGQLPIYIFL